MTATFPAQECAPVSVDSCGTYFRVVTAADPKSLPRRTRVVIVVAVDKDGRKIVTVSNVGICA